MEGNTLFGKVISRFQSRSTKLLHSKLIKSFIFFYFQVYLLRYQSKYVILLLIFISNDPIPFLLNFKSSILCFFPFGSLCGGILLIGGLYLVLWGKNREAQRETKDQIVENKDGNTVI